MLWFLLGAIFILLFLIALERWQKDEEFEKIPGPKGTILVQNALDFIMDPVKLFYYFRTLANTYKYLFKVYFGPKRIVLLYNPEDVEVILSSTRSTKKGFLYQLLEPWLQDGLLLSDGPKWLQRRRILTPAFHFNILRRFHTILEENSWTLVKKLRDEVDKPKTDVTSFISDFTINSICETAMGITLDEQSNKDAKVYKNAIHQLGQLLVYRGQRIWLFINWIYRYTNNGIKQRQVLHQLSSFRDSVINNRRETCDFEDLIREAESMSETDDESTRVYSKKKLAMLDLLLQAEKQGIIDAKGIGEEVDTFMFEGHDTTATALQFILMSLANHLDVQDKARKEVDKIFKGSNRATTMNDLTQMKYLECCIKESMRLYPPVHFVMRTITETTKLKNCTVPAGTECTILVYDLQRRDDQFVEPLKFNPERFLGEPTWHPYSYVPFSAGPRNCIGQKFAMMEMKLAVSSVLRHFKMLPVTLSQDVVLITDFILRPNHPVYVQFRNRDEKLITRDVLSARA